MVPEQSLETVAVTERAPAARASSEPSLDARALSERSREAQASRPEGAEEAVGARVWPAWAPGPRLARTLSMTCQGRRVHFLVGAGSCAGAQWPVVAQWASATARVGDAGSRGDAPRSTRSARP